MLINWQDFGYLIGLLLLATYTYGRETSCSDRGDELCSASEGSLEQLSCSISESDSAPTTHSMDPVSVWGYKRSIPERAAGMAKFRRVMPYGREEPLVRWCESN